VVSPGDTSFFSPLLVLPSDQQAREGQTTPIILHRYRVVPDVSAAHQEQPVDTPSLTAFKSIAASMRYPHTLILPSTLIHSALFKTIFAGSSPG